VEPQVCMSFSTVIGLVYILGAACAPAVVLRVKSGGLLRIVGAHCRGLRDEGPGCLCQLHTPPHTHSRATQAKLQQLPELLCRHELQSLTVCVLVWSLTREA
jgi:hypothetical protein